MLNGQSFVLPVSKAPPSMMLYKPTVTISIWINLVVTCSYISLFSSSVFFNNARASVTSGSALLCILADKILSYPLCERFSTTEEKYQLWMDEEEGLTKRTFSLPDIVVYPRFHKHTPTCYLVAQS